MNHTVAHMRKINNVPGFQKIASHNMREEEKPYFDKGKTQQNYSLIKEEKSGKGSIADRLQERLSTVKKTIRKDAVRAVEFVVSGTPEALNQLSPREQKKYFRESLSAIQKRMGKKNILSAMVHLDEKTPHLHVLATPVTEDGRLCLKDFINGRGDLVKYQDEMGQIGAKYGMARGIHGSRATHQDLNDYSKILNASVSDVPKKKLLESDLSYQNRLKKYALETNVVQAKEYEKAIKKLEENAKKFGIDKVGEMTGSQQARFSMEVKKLSQECVLASQEERFQKEVDDHFQRVDEYREQYSRKPNNRDNQMIARINQIIEMEKSQKDKEKGR